VDQTLFQGQVDNMPMKDSVSNTPSIGK
jgi:hypothetical protein